MLLQAWLAAIEIPVFDIKKILAVTKFLNVQNYGFDSFLPQFESFQQTWSEYYHDMDIISSSLDPDRYLEIALSDIGSYLQNPYLLDHNQRDSWHEVFLRAATLLITFPSLADDSSITTNPFYQKLPENNGFKNFIIQNLAQNRDRLTDLKNRTAFLSDMRSWEIQRDQRLKDLEKLNLQFGAGKDSGSDLIAFDSKLLALSNQIELEKLQIDCQKLMLLRTGREDLLKKQIRDIDAGRRKSSPGDEKFSPRQEEK
jgi:hypothetical protein